MEKLTKKNKILKGNNWLKILKYGKVQTRKRKLNPASYFGKYGKNQKLKFDCFIFKYGTPRIYAKQQTTLIHIIITQLGILPCIIIDGMAGYGINTFSFLTDFPHHIIRKINVIAYEISSERCKLLRYNLSPFNNWNLLIINKSISSLFKDLNKISSFQQKIIVFLDPPWNNGNINIDNIRIDKFCKKLICEPKIVCIVIKLPFYFNFKIFRKCNFFVFWHCNFNNVVRMKSVIILKNLKHLNNIIQICQTVFKNVPHKIWQYKNDFSFGQNMRCKYLNSS